jgi:hypothetical protein
MTKNKPAECKIHVTNEGEMFVAFADVRIAKRKNRKWGSLEKGWRVKDVGYPPEAIEIYRDGVGMH